jgi:hypothetical protein
MLFWCELVWQCHKHQREASNHSADVGTLIPPHSKLSL